MHCRIVATGGRRGTALSSRAHRITVHNTARVAGVLRRML